MRIIHKEKASKILRTVTHPNAFYFFTDIGEYSGESAASLAEFNKKIKTVDGKSVDFHFGRHDFEIWIRRTIGDEYLADTVSKMPQSLHGEKLRGEINKAVERRLTQLKKLLASKKKYLERL
jgi:hypothetical protein